MCVAPAKPKKPPECFCVTVSQPVPVTVLQMVSPDRSGEVSQGCAEPHMRWKMLLSPSAGSLSPQLWRLLPKVVPDALLSGPSRYNPGVCEDEGSAAGLEVFACLSWNNWVIAASRALPVVWERAHSPVPTQPCTAQALLPPTPLPTASAFCLLWPGLGGSHSSQGSHHLPEPTHLGFSGEGGSCSSQQRVGPLGEVLPGAAATLLLAQARE